MKTVLKILRITLGALIYATGTIFIIDMHDLAPGGASGCAVILNRISMLILPDGKSIPIGVFLLLINIPLLIAGQIKFGKGFLMGTVYGTLAVSMFTYLLEPLRDWMLQNGQDWFMIENTVVASIAAGIFMAAGVSTVFKVGATTGGTDIVAKLIKLKFKHVKLGKIFLIMDTCIAFSSLPVVDFQIEKVLYSLICMFICSRLIDFFMYGTDEAKLVYIVSDKSEYLAEKVLKDLDMGGTFLDGVGAYSKAKKEVLMCVVKKQQFPRLKEMVCREDPDAFLIVSSASEVFGKGYKSAQKEEI